MYIRHQYKLFILGYSYVTTIISNNANAIEITTTRDNYHKTQCHIGATGNVKSS